MKYPEEFWLKDTKLAEEIGREVPEELLYYRHAAADYSNDEFSVAKSRGESRHQ